MGRRAKPKVYEGEAEFLFDWYIFAFNMAGVLEYIGNAGEPVSAEVVKRCAEKYINDTKKYCVSMLKGTRCEPYTEKDYYGRLTEEQLRECLQNNDINRYLRAKAEKLNGRIRRKGYAADIMESAAMDYYVKRFLEKAGDNK